MLSLVSDLLTWHREASVEKRFTSAQLPVKWLMHCRVTSEYSCGFQAFPINLKHNSDFKNNFLSLKKNCDDIKLFYIIISEILFSNLLNMEKNLVTIERFGCT